LSCSSRHSSPSPSTAVHRRSRAHRSKLWWPKSSGSCTIVLALPLWSWINNSYQSIRRRSSDLKITCEFLRRWRHGLPRHPVWPGLCLGGRWPGQEPHQSVILASVCVGTKHFLCLLEISEINQCLGNSYLIHFNSEKCIWYTKMFRKT
jgi:hypothetical protein